MKPYPLTLSGKPYTFRLNARAVVLAEDRAGRPLGDLIAPTVELITLAQTVLETGDLPEDPTDLLAALRNIRGGDLATLIWAAANHKRSDAVDYDDLLEDLDLVEIPNLIAHLQLGDKADTAKANPDQTPNPSPANA